MPMSFDLGSLSTDYGKCHHFWPLCRGAASVWGWLGSRISWWLSHFQTENRQGQPRWSRGQR